MKRLPQYRSIALTIIILLLAACGGGGSTSSGSTIATAPALPFFSQGQYSGSMILNISNESYSSDPTETPILFSVAGAQAGSQQVSIAFTQFSGSSSINPNGEFSIPSGTFRLRIVDRSEVITFATCEGELLFTGMFIGTTANGTVTGQFNCPFSSLPLVAEGTFNTNLQSGKHLGRTIDLDLIYELQ